MPGDARHVPHFISAANPDRLVRAMFLNNVKDHKEYRYFDIAWDGKKWTAWYYKKVEIEIPLTRKGSD